MAVHTSFTNLTPGLHYSFYVHTKMDRFSIHPQGTLMKATMFKLLLHLSPHWLSHTHKISFSFSENEGGDKFTVPKWGRNYTFVPRDKQRELLSSSGHWPHQEGPPTPWQTWSSFQKGGRDQGSGEAKEGNVWKTAMKREGTVQCSASSSNQLPCTVVKKDKQISPKLTRSTWIY